MQQRTAGSGPAGPELLAAMGRALHIAAAPGIRPGANPRVGCVLLDASGRPQAEGVHRGAGTPHAEVDALRAWRRADRAGSPHTAVVTLEPCAHTGRTGPCTEALLQAGVRRVVLATADPDPRAAGGADRLRAAGVEVVAGVLRKQALALNAEWFAATLLRRPHVTWKLATTVDGRVAAADGSSRWISSAQSRADAHLARAAVDAIVVGTGTALSDDPQLAARDTVDRPLPPDLQPLRVVMGLRAVPPGARVRDESAQTLILPTRDPAQVLATLWDNGVRRVLLEGGPTVAAAFWRGGLVDRVVLYLAPALLGAGPLGVSDLGIGSIQDAARLDITDVARCGPDLKITYEPVRAAGTLEESN